MHYGDAAASLLTWSHTLRLLFISKSKIDSERTPFWVSTRDPEVCNAGLKQHSTSCVPGMLQRMAAPLEKVCAGTRDVLWRWPHFSWWMNNSFGTSLITLLSDHVLLYFNIINLWDHLHICVLALTETSWCSAWLYCRPCCQQGDMSVMFCSMFHFYCAMVLRGLLKK